MRLTDVQHEPANVESTLRMMLHHWTNTNHNGNFGKYVGQGITFAASHIENAVLYRPNPRYKYNRARHFRRPRPAPAGLHTSGSGKRVLRNDMPQINNIRGWPAPGSVAMVDHVLVIKLGSVNYQQRLLLDHMHPLGPPS
jgi:hypothetical protein